MPMCVCVSAAACSYISSFFCIRLRRLLAMYCFTSHEFCDPVECVCDRSHGLFMCLSFVGSFVVVISWETLERVSVWNTKIKTRNNKPSHMKTNNSNNNNSFFFVCKMCVELLDVTRSHFFSLSRSHFHNLNSPLFYLNVSVRESESESDETTNERTNMGSFSISLDWSLSAHFVVCMWVCEWIFVCVCVQVFVVFFFGEAPCVYATDALYTTSWFRRYQQIV